LEDQARLKQIVGQLRQVIKIDAFGFIWLSFSASEASEDFCLPPGDLECVS
jgi:hypothetical protein